MDLSLFWLIVAVLVSPFWLVDVLTIDRADAPCQHVDFRYWFCSASRPNKSAHTFIIVFPIRSGEIYCYHLCILTPYNYPNISHKASNVHHNNIGPKLVFVRMSSIYASHTKFICIGLSRFADQNVMQSRLERENEKAEHERTAEPETDLCWQMRFFILHFLDAKSNLYTLDISVFDNL